MRDQPARRGYPSDVSDEEWWFVAPYLCLLPEDCGQRKYALREVFNGLRSMVRAGCPWRLIPHDLPPWEMIYQQSQRWIKAEVFEAMCHDLRVLVRLTQGRHPQPSAAILDGRTVQSTPESGGRAGYDGHKKIGILAEAVQEVTGQNGQLAGVDQGYNGPAAAQAAAEHGLTLEVVKLAEAKKGFVLLPRRWVVERTFGWMARCRRLARDYERLPGTFAGLHWVMFAGLLLARLNFQSFVSS